MPFGGAFAHAEFSADFGMAKPVYGKQVKYLLGHGRQQAQHIFQLLQVKMLVGLVVVAGLFMFFIFEGFVQDGVFPPVFLAPEFVNQGIDHDAAHPGQQGYIGWYTIEVLEDFEETHVEGGHRFLLVAPVTHAHAHQHRKGFPIKLLLCFPIAYLGELEHFRIKRSHVVVGWEWLLLGLRKIGVQRWAGDCFLFSESIENIELGILFCCFVQNIRPTTIVVGRVKKQIFVGMVSITPFQPAFLDVFLDEQRTLPFSYAATNATRTAYPVNGYDNDENTIRLGRGPEVWQKACTAIRSWRMFPGTWARIYPDQAPIVVGQTVAMSAYVWGVWWRNACRIVYIIDEPDRFGFAYGTLPGHVETGEELFCVEQDADGWIWYRIKAFSRPRFWLARLAYPVARAQQRKFVRDSKFSMFNAVNNG